MVRLIFIIALAAQIIFWQSSRAKIVPIDDFNQKASYQQMKLSAFGEDNLYFYNTAYQMQTAGDGFGRTTPLKDLNYQNLSTWWHALDKLNPNANIIPALTSYIFSLSQNPARDVPYIVNYLNNHADNDPSNAAWWHYQALYLAKYKLGNQALAAQIATKIPNDKSIPIWIRQIKAITLLDNNEGAKACDVILSILSNVEQIPPHEQNYIYDFVETRLQSCNITPNES